MAKQVINVGTTAGDGSGDALRDAMIKINANFTELYEGIVVQTIVGEYGTTLVDISTNSVNADALTGTVPTGVATWANLGGKPTSVAGFGIADAYTIAQTDAQIASEIDDLKISLAADGGDLKGSVFADDSTLLVDGVNGKITGEVTGTISSTNWMASSDNYLTIANGGSTGPGPIQIVASANLDLTSGTNNDINMSPHGSGRVKVSDGGLGIVEAANFMGHADQFMYLSSKTTGSESTHIALNSTSGVQTTMYGAVDFASGGSATFNGNAIFDTGVQEKFATLTGSTGTVTHDCDNGHIFYHTTPAADWTANFTNLGLTAEYATTLSIVIAQGATAYIPTAVQIGGVAQTILWQGGSQPSGTTSGTDVVAFSILNDGGTYVVMGQLVGFS
jgi:hypothetical protein